jgi:hypothetical protein
MNPLDPGNPLTLRQITTSMETNVATFEVPVSYTTLTNTGSIELWAEGRAVPFQEVDQNTNGDCLVTWETLYDSPGQHVLQLNLNLNGVIRKGSTPDSTVLIAQGAATPFLSTNVLEFDPFYTEYDATDGATLYAKLAEPNADYTIELTDPSGNTITNISGSTSTGEITENWDLNGGAYTNDSFDAAFNFTFPDGNFGPFKVRYYKLPFADGNFTIAYAWDVSSEASGSMHDAIQYGVVDELIKPTSVGGENDYNYDSTFNDYTWVGNLNGNPGYINRCKSACILMDFWKQCRPEYAI